MNKKYLIAGGIGLVSITAAVLYLQYKKLMEYCISFNKFVLKKISFDKLDLDLYLNFKNESSLKINILSQEYTAYLNDIEVARVSNPDPQTIEPKNTSVLKLNVAADPKSLANKLKVSSASFLTNPSAIILTVKVSLKVKLYFISVSIPYEYKTTLKDLIANKQSNSSTSNQKKC